MEEDDKKENGIFKKIFLALFVLVNGRWQMKVDGGQTFFLLGRLKAV